MTSDEVDALSNELRAQIQERTCCPAHAGDVLLQIMASFVLDGAQDDNQKAAREVERVAKNLAKRIRAGKYVVTRMKPYEDER